MVGGFSALLAHATPMHVKKPSTDLNVIKWETRVSMSESKAQGNCDIISLIKQLNECFKTSFLHIFSQNNKVLVIYLVDLFIWEI